MLYPLRQPILILALCVLAPTTPLRPHELRVKVKAGAHESRDVPVHADAKLGKHSGAGVWRRGSETGPVQLEELSGGVTRVHWVIGKLDPGAELVYEIDLDSAPAPSAAGYLWKPSSGDHGTSMDLYFGARRVLRYMYTPFDKNDIELTKKVFHHLWSPDGSRRLTKGPGGLYAHHRGIYFGYNRIRVGDRKGRIDTWHAHKGEHQVHKEVLASYQGPVFGGHKVKIHWNDRQGKTFIEETRRIVVFRQSRGHHLVDFQSELVSTGAPVHLDGDPQHAGVQFRASQYVAENQKKTRYLRPEKWKELPENRQVNWPKNKDHREMPWNAIRFSLPNESGELQPYTVAYLSHPSNPGEGRSSERLYGRFGEYFAYNLTQEKPLRVHYRWWVTTSHSTQREEVQVRYEDFSHPPELSILR